MSISDMTEGGLCNLAYYRFFRAALPTLAAAFIALRCKMLPDLHITAEVFDEVAAELADVLDSFQVPQREKQEVLAAFNAHKPDVTAGSLTSMERGVR